jgi:hypothetical protein
MFDILMYSFSISVLVLLGIDLYKDFTSKDSVIDILGDDNE